MQNLARLDAQTLIKSGNIGDDPDTIRNLYLLAYEDQKMADRAYAKAVEHRADRITRR